MSQKIVSQLDAAGVFIGATVADADPLEPGSFLVPGGAVDAAPPEVPPGHVARWAGEWVFEPVPVEPVQPPPAPPTHAQLVQQFDQALTSHLDVTARARRYDNRITCALRAGYPGPFQAEGQAFATWMDGCNALAYQWLAEIEAGTRPMFASTDEFISALPEMVWPAS